MIAEQLSRMMHVSQQDKPYIAENSFHRPKLSNWRLLKLGALPNLAITSEDVLLLLQACATQYPT